MHTKAVAVADKLLIISSQLCLIFLKKNKSLYDVGLPPILHPKTYNILGKGNKAPSKLPSNPIIPPIVTIHFEAAHPISLKA